MNTTQNKTIALGKFECEAKSLTLRNFHRNEQGEMIQSPINTRRFKLAATSCKKQGISASQLRRAFQLALIRS